MMGKHQRQKGATWEREVAKLLRLAGFTDARRGLGQARSASEVADVACVPGWWVECKHHKEARPLAALEQAEAVACGLRPVAICKSNRRPPTATWRERVGGVEMVVTTSLASWIAMVAQQEPSRHETP